MSRFNFNFTTGVRRNNEPPVETRDINSFIENTYSRTYSRLDVSSSCREVLGKYFEIISERIKPDSYVGFEISFNHTSYKEDTEYYKRIVFWVLQLFHSNEILSSMSGPEKSKSETITIRGLLIPHRVNYCVLLSSLVFILENPDLHRFCGKGEPSLSEVTGMVSSILETFDHDKENHDIFFTALTLYSIARGFGDNIYVNGAASFSRERLSLGKCIMEFFKKIPNSVEVAKQLEIYSLSPYLELYDLQHRTS